ncbi:MAG: HU family DNA-binding protein [Nitrospira sp.]|nr:HU family DNA-binding protein [Nitrospira sp.]
MTKAEFVDAIQKAAKGSTLSKRETEDLVDSIFDVLSKSIKKDKRFAFPGFGTFSVRSRKARSGRNPRTGETIKIKASKTVSFKPAPKLKGML